MIPNSVSALKARHRVKISDLPLELWLVIFDHATYVPRIFIPEIYEHSSSLGYGFNRYHHPLIRRALVTKRYLVRVCKQWWHLATPFLYRSIFIGRGRCIPSLARTLALSAGGNGVLAGERPLGSYTERLDIAMRDHYAYWERNMELLAEVIRHLQNLAVVSFDVTSSSSSSSSSSPYIPSCDTVMDALICVAPSIKIIHWSTPGLLPRPQSLQNLVTATQPHVLHCTHHLSGSADPMDNCTLSSCTTLAVTSDHIFHQLSSAQLPALRELVYHERLWGILPPHLGRFLERHGKNLTSIHLYLPASGNSLGQVNLLEAHCQNLRRLTIMFDFWELLSAEMFENVPIEYLGLGSWQHQSPTKTYKITFPTLARLKDANPALRTIRFINYSNVNDLLKNHHKALLPALELLSGSNFRLEDHEGRLLSDRVMPSNA